MAAILPFISDASDNFAYTIDRTGDQINFIDVVANGITYRQTWTYTGGVVTSISAYLKQ